MQLFNGDVSYSEAKGLDHVIATPLGNIGLNFSYNDIEITSALSRQAFVLESGGYIVRWTNEEVEAELLLCKPDTSLPKTLSVNGCVAALWRIRANKNIENIRFSARWGNVYLWTNQDADSGEHLEAMNWDDGVTKVTLGTQNGELIASRMKNNFMMPVEVNKNFNIKYYREGLVVPFEKIYANKVCQIHFVVAWGLCDPVNIGTWFAVDMDPQTILKSSKLT